MATNNLLEAAMAKIETAFKPEITAPKAYAAHQKAQAERLPYAAARADLDARARAGKTIQGRNSKGRFTRGVKTFTAGVAPAAKAPVKAAKVEARRAPVSPINSQCEADASAALRMAAE